MGVGVRIIGGSIAACNVLVKHCNFCSAGGFLPGCFSVAFPYLEALSVRSSEDLVYRFFWSQKLSPLPQSTALPVWQIALKVHGSVPGVVGVGLCIPIGSM